ncbi:MAG: hypothetical protein GXC94_15750 [Comamonadaceae bacterium]|nr:hypothetical protein [Comamonadaceae bacterium]
MAICQLGDAVGSLPSASSDTRRSARIAAADEGATQRLQNDRAPRHACLARVITLPQRGA